MKNRKIKLFIIIPSLIGMFILCALIMLSVFSEPQEYDNVKTLKWIPEESYFISYEIKGDKVKFKYSICFDNNSENNVEIFILAKFKNSETKYWIKNEFLTGMDDNGEGKYQIIISEEKINVDYVFEGDYLGGPVNTKISFPDELVLVTK